MLRWIVVVLSSIVVVWGQGCRVYPLLWRTQDPSPLSNAWPLGYKAQCSNYLSIRANYHPYPSVQLKDSTLWIMGLYAYQGKWYVALLRLNKDLQEIGAWYYGLSGNYDVMGAGWDIVPWNDKRYILAIVARDSVVDSTTVVLFFQIDTSGNVLWQRSYRFTSQQIGLWQYSELLAHDDVTIVMEKTNDNDLIVIASIRFRYFDFVNQCYSASVYMRLDSLGNLKKVLHGSYEYGDNSSGVLGSGINSLMFDKAATYVATCGGAWGPAIVVLDSSLQIQQFKRFQYSFLEPSQLCSYCFQGSLRGIVPLSGGGYLFYGFVPYYNEGSHDIVLLFTDSLLRIYRSVVLGSAEQEVPFVVTATDDGGYLIGGCTFSIDSLFVTTMRAIVIKTDALGNPQWTKTFNNVRFITGIYERSDGSFVLIGATQQDSLWIGSMDSSGNMCNSCGAQDDKIVQVLPKITWLDTPIVWKQDATFSVSSPSIGLATTTITLNGNSICP